MSRKQAEIAARQIVAQRRQAAEVQAALLRTRLMQAEPRLSELAQKQSEAGACAARLAADGMMNEAQEQRAQMHAVAKKQAELLRKLGQDENAFSPKYHCAACNDTGYVKSRTCHCVLEETKRIRRQEIQDGGALSLCRFESFSLDKYPEKMEGLHFSPRKAMADILTDCKDWAAEFGPKSKSLFMYGDAGLGKTHLALSIASEVLSAGFDVLYVSAQSAFASISAERNVAGARTLQGMLQADLLVLDDLGTEYLDAYTRSRLYELVNGRMHRRPTIYTTNICRQDVLNQRYDEKIASRLLGECHRMRFFGNDIRLMR